jgi:putative membrane protein
MHKSHWIAAAIALAGSTASCSSDEQANEQTYPQPAASVGEEATPLESESEPVTKQLEAEPTTQPVGSALRPEAETPAATPSNAMSRPGDEPIAESLRDTQIVKILDLVNSGEVEQAHLAKTKANDPQVKQFAQQMITQHTQAKQKGMQLARAANLNQEESTESAQVETQGMQTVATLKTVDPTSFDGAYMRAQIEQHQAVLDMLNSRLIPSVTNPKLKTELENTRRVVERHLASARQIQGTLGIAE